MKNATVNLAVQEDNTVVSAWGNAVGATCEAARITIDNSYSAVCDAWDESPTTTKVIVVGGLGAVVGIALYAVFH